MAELRWNPMIKDWIIIASHRQNRPQMPKDWCPFCPGSEKIPETYDVLKYDNDFPALSLTPPKPDDVADDFFKVSPAYGKCEVILYSPDHHGALTKLSDEHLGKLADLWAERFNALSADEKVKYVFIFENRGEVVGVTMPHPHGQIYALSFIPKKISLELDASKEYHSAHGSCLFCDMLSNETRDGRRVIFENEFFTVFLPFFTEYPYGVYVMPKRHLPTIACLDDSERKSLALTIRDIVGMFDSLFDYQFPYMMCMHNAPVNSGCFDEHYHFHIEFYPPMRSATKQKFNASSETGVWTYCNPTCPETVSEELRQAYGKFLASR